MPIPNEAQVTYKDQAEIDFGDMAIWENVHQGYSVLSGGVVTEQGTPDGTVAVAAGTAKVGGAGVSWASGNVSVLSGSANADGSTALSADTQARFDLIVVNASGQLGVAHGTSAGLSPTGDGSYTDVFPTFAGKTVLAAIRIPPSFTTVVTNMLSDKRVIKTDGDFVARPITPTALSANQNDYAPTSAAAWAAANVLRQATNNTTQRNLTGLLATGHLDGKIIILHNLGPGEIGLLDESGSSAAANRFALVGDIVVPVDRTVALMYDVTALRWRALGAQTAAGANTIALGSAVVAGTQPYFLRSDDTIAAFDATVPVTQAYSDAAATGSAAKAARRDHKHGMPAASAGLAADTFWAAKGDLAVASANDTAAVLTAPTTRQQRLSADEAGNLSWKPLAAGPAGVRLWDEMFYAVSIAVASTGQYMGALTSSLVGVVSALAVTTGEANHPGCCNLTTGTDTNGKAGLTALTTSIVLGGGRARFGGWIKTSASLSDGTNRYETGLGFMDSTQFSVVDGAFLHYRDNVNGGKWEAVTSSNSVTTVADTGITVAASTWYFLEVEVNAAGTSVAFYIDKTLVATITTNIPTGAGRETGVGIILLKSLGTTSRVVTLDAWYLELDFTTAR